MKRPGPRQHLLRNTGGRECRVSIERALGEQGDLLELFALLQIVETRCRDELATGEIAVVFEPLRPRERAYEETEKKGRPVTRNGGIEGLEVERRCAGGEGFDRSTARQTSISCANEAGGLELPDDQGGDTDDDRCGKCAENESRVAR